MTWYSKFTDDFDRGDSTNLGANWSEDVGDWAVSGNLLAVTPGAGIYANVVQTVHSAADTAAEIVLVNAADAGYYGGPIARFKDTDNQYFGWSSQAGGRYYLFKNVGGYTSLGQWIVAPQDGDVSKVTVEGTAVKLLVNGTERISNTDSDVAGVGSTGVKAYGTTAHTFNDFESWDTVSAGYASDVFASSVFDSQVFGRL